MNSNHAIYEIVVQGHLARHMVDWQDGLEMDNLANGQTRIRAALPDQAALFGLLSHLYHLGVELISVNRTGQSLHDR